MEYCLAIKRKLYFIFREIYGTGDHDHVRGGISRTQTSTAFSFMWSVREKYNQENLKVESSEGWQSGLREAGGDVSMTVTKACYICAHDRLQ